jgi:SAM-dependent methyltransferase
MKTEAYRLMQDLEESHWWFRARNAIICQTVVGFAEPQSDLLDYGCGTGGLAMRLRALGFHVVGADVSEEALSACSASGLPIVDLRDECLDPESADTVLACDVLEHIEDDGELLATLRRTLRPGGYLIATVPAYELLWSGEDYVSEHVRRYTRPLLKRQLRAAGYDIIRCTYFNTVLFPVQVMVILGKRLFRPRDMYRSNVHVHGNRQNTALYTLFALERRLLPWMNFPIGGSILAVARRPA